MYNELTQQIEFWDKAPKECKYMYYDDMIPEIVGMRQDLDKIYDYLMSRYKNEGID